jgi:hypothetical protein
MVTMHRARRRSVELRGLHSGLGELGLVLLACACSCASEVEYGTWSIDPDQPGSRK